MLFVESACHDRAPETQEGFLLLKIKGMGLFHQERRHVEEKSAGRRQRMRWLDDIIDSVESEQTLGDGGGQGSLACCSPWGLKELDVTKQ